MTREEFKQKVYRKSKSDESMYPNYIHLLSLYPFIEQLFDEHEAQLKQAYINGSNSTNELIQSLYKQIEQLKDK